MNKLEKLRERVLYVISSAEQDMCEIQNDSYRLAETEGGLCELYWVLHMIDKLIQEEKNERT